MAKDLYQNEKLQRLSSKFYLRKKKRAKSVTERTKIKNFCILPLKILKQQREANFTRLF